MQTTGGSSTRAEQIPQLWALQLLLGAAIAVSIVHYVDNTVRWDDFIAADPSDRTLSFIDRWMIPSAWALFTAFGIAGYRMYRQRRFSQAAPCLAVYSVSGLIGIGHYVDISPSQLSTFQNTHVITDIVFGVLMVAFAIRTMVRVVPEP
jgi:hypothetical protein